MSAYQIHKSHVKATKIFWVNVTFIGNLINALLNILLFQSDAYLWLKFDKILLIAFLLTQENVVFKFLVS